MAESFQLVVDALAETLGLSSSVITTILFITMSITISLAVMAVIGSTLLGLLVSIPVLLYGAFAGLVPLWVVLFYSFAGGCYIFFLGFGRDSSSSSPATRKRKNSRELILGIEKSSSNWSQYINNLDSLLGIRTVNDENPGSEYGLKLGEGRELFIHLGYDWYITDKHPEQDIFKVVGLHKEDSLENLVYLLGKNPGTGEPFLTSIPSAYLEGDLEECLIWSKREKLSPNVGGFIGTSTSTLVNIVPVIFVASILLGAVTWLSRK